MNARFTRSWHKAITGLRFTLFAPLTLLAVLILSACSPAVPTATLTPPPTPPPPSPTALPSVTSIPTQTALPSPTITLTPTIEPTATPTAIPPLAILKDGFDAWCVPGDSHNLGVLTSKMPSDAGHYKQLKDAIQLTVPMGDCVFVYTFNQAVPANAEFQIYDIFDHLAYKMPLISPEGQPNVGVATVNNQLMMSPPYYVIKFRLAVFTPENGQMWTSNVNFSRPVPEACFDPKSGILPNPVTGACPAADPREPELCRKPGSISCYTRGVTSEDDPRP